METDRRRFDTGRFCLSFCASLSLIPQSGSLKGRVCQKPGFLGSFLEVSVIFLEETVIFLEECMRFGLCLFCTLEGSVIFLQEAAGFFEESARFAGESAKSLF